MKGLLFELPFWNKLTGEQQERIKASVKTVKYKKNSLIYAKNQECLGLIRVLKGSIKTYMSSPDGREITIYTLKKGDTDLLSAACVANKISFETQMTASEDSELMVIPASYLARLKEENIDVKCYIYEQLGERFLNVICNLQEILFVPVESRIIRFLLQLSEETGRSEIKTTHEKIAGEINSSREVVSRILKDLEREGALQLERGKVILKNKDYLKMRLM